MWSLGCLLCDILLRGSMCRSHRVRQCSTLLACIDLRVPHSSRHLISCGRRGCSAHFNGAAERPRRLTACCQCTSHHRCGEQLFDAERVDGHQVLRNKDEKDAKSAAQLHLLHSCLGTPTEQVGFALYVLAYFPTIVIY